MNHTAWNIKSSARARAIAQWAERAFALHVANQLSISSTLYGFMSQPRVILACRARGNPWTLLRVAPKQKEERALFNRQVFLDKFSLNSWLGSEFQGQFSVIHLTNSYWVFLHDSASLAAHCRSIGGVSPFSSQGGHCLKNSVCSRKNLGGPGAQQPPFATTEALRRNLWSLCSKWLTESEKSILLAVPLFAQIFQRIWEDRILPCETPAEHHQTPQTANKPYGISHKFHRS